MPRAFVIVIDGFGIGPAPDAGEYGDTGADTLGHIAEACALGKADRTGLRKGALTLPFLSSLGLGKAAELATGHIPHGLNTSEETGLYAAAREQSLGKDTPSGHWELAGVPVEFKWGTFPPAHPSFPPKLVKALVSRGNIPGILGNCAESGTEILARLGNEHMRTGKPICYTSVDSVFQIAAHEESFGLDRLLDLCTIAREICDEYNIGRVIARPFIGRDGMFRRTANRHDFSIPPPRPTLLELLAEDGREVVSVGKIADIFAHRGPTRLLSAPTTRELMDHVLEQARSAPDGSLTFANLVDFDSAYGHRRDATGYASALERLDPMLAELNTMIRQDDLVVVTSDHGCDPTYPGTDHTREYVPVLMFGPRIPLGPAGIRNSFADVGQSVAAHLGIDPLPNGLSML